MGTWNTRLFSNDTTADVRDTYTELLKKQVSDEEAYHKTLEEYRELLGTDEEPLFWYALADCQWKFGRLIPEVKDKALHWIYQMGGIELWEGQPKRQQRWQETLFTLKEKLETPMPPRKNFRMPKEFGRNPWNVGDVYAYEFHTKQAEEHSLCGKYILFQKIGNCETYGDMTFSIIRVFDQIFEHIPTLGEIKRIRILPLTSAPGVEGNPSDIGEYLPSFDCYMEAIMYLDKQGDYPEKYFQFIGNKYEPDIERLVRNFNELDWKKDSMEVWLIDYYLQWRGVSY